MGPGALRLCQIDLEKYRVSLWPRGKMLAKKAELLVKSTKYYKMD